MQRLVEHFGFKVEIALKLLLQQLQIPFAIESRQFFKWLQFFNTERAFPFSKSVAWPANSLSRGAMM
jgi:hypothetical protein